jgi:hypothetical protein
MQQEAERKKKIEEEKRRQVEEQRNLFKRIRLDSPLHVKRTEMKVKKEDFR